MVEIPRRRKCSANFEPPRRFAPPLLSQGGDKTRTVHGFFPSLSQEGWPRQGPGWFAPQRGEIPQLIEETYIYAPSATTIRLRPWALA